MRSLTLFVAVLFAIGTISSVEPAHYFFGFRLPTMSSFSPPTRNRLRKIIALLKPHKDDRYWHDFDLDGYSRNGRDIHKMETEVDDKMVM